jgi:hypothetical protein
VDTDEVEPEEVEPEEAEPDEVEPEEVEPEEVEPEEVEPEEAEPEEAELAEVELEFETHVFDAGSGMNGGLQYEMVHVPHWVTAREALVNSQGWFPYPLLLNWGSVHGLVWLANGSHTPIESKEKRMGRGIGE